MNLSNTSHEEVIASRHHPLIRRVRALQGRAERDRTGTFFCEGIRFVAYAIESGFHLEHIVYAPALLKHSFGQRLVKAQRHAGVPCLPLTPEVFESLSQNDEAQGIGAVVRQKWTLPCDADPRRGLCWIALEEVRSPGNLGTMLRTSEAVGGAGFILLNEEVDPYHPACVRSSMAATFLQRFVRFTMDEFRAWKQQHGCALVGTSPDATLNYDAAEYRAPLILFMGGERKGLSGEAQALCDALVSIPMAGRSDSLNLGVATGVMLYEVLRQRRAPLRMDGVN